MVAFNTAPPYRSQYGLTSVPPPARPNRNGALAWCILISIEAAKIKRILKEHIIPIHISSEYHSKFYATHHVL
jgi:hypothetical protein